MFLTIFTINMQVMSSVDTSKIELHLYLKDPKLPLLKDFDTLDWWHKNTRHFPTLAKMAPDLLALPFSRNLSVPFTVSHVSPYFQIP